MTNTKFIPTVSAALVALAAMLPATAAAASPRCESKSGETLVQQGSTRVFQRVKRSSTDSDANTVTVYSCKSRSRKARRLTTFRNDLDASITVRTAYVAAGRWVVLDTDSSGGTGDGRVVFEYDASKGKAQFHWATDDTFEAGQPLVVTNTGAIAAAGPNGSVIAFDDAGQRTLEPGGATDLAAAGSRVYWTLAAGARSAVLGAAPSGRVG